MASAERVQIESLGEHGEGVARHRGRPLFIQGALPAEEVEVEILLEKNSYSVGRLLRILQPSPLRQEAPCPLFLRCGGCQLQHLQQSGQLAWKRQRVVEALHTAGVSAVVGPCQPSPQDWHYRCKMLMPVQDNQMGLYALQSHELIPVSACMVHSPQGEQVHQALQRWLSARGPFEELKHCLLRTSASTGSVLLALVLARLDLGLWKALAQDLACAIEHGTSAGQHPARLVGIVANIQPEAINTVLGRESHVLWGRGAIEDTLAGIPVQISATSFFQVNPPQANCMAQRILLWAAQNPGSRVCDLFCGAGAMALALAEQGHDVMGVDIVPSAIADAQATALALGLDARFECARAEQWLAQQHKEWDALLLNPPRKGCDVSLLQQILLRRPHRLCMVSCNPESLARDLAVLSQDYELAEALPYDLFPQTTHVETLVTLNLRASV
jgi:23S rRNA (uracil1939-C5)-methyltransferase